MWKALRFTLKRSLELAFFLCLLTSSVKGIVIRDDSGREVVFDRLPRRVVSLAPSFTKALVLLGLKDRLVGVTMYCNLPAVSGLPRVGSVTDFNLEKILQLKPDLVLATPLVPKAQLRRLEDFRIKVVIFRAPEDFKKLCEQFKTLSRIFGREERAGEILSQVQRRLIAVKRRIAGKPRPRVILQIGADPLWVAGKKSFLGEAVQLAGGDNPIEGEGGPISRELVIKLDPEVILIVDMGMTGEREVEKWRSFGAIKAVRNGRIYLLKSDLYCSPTPLSFAQGVEELEGLLHGGRKGSIKGDELLFMWQPFGTRGRPDL